jgi:hypothetical protein
VLYHVDSAGHATEYGNTTIANSKISGSLSDFAISPTGRQIAIASFTRGGICGGDQQAFLIDTASGTALSPVVPAGGGPEGY